MRVDQSVRRLDAS